MPPPIDRDSAEFTSWRLAEQRKRRLKGTGGVAAAIAVLIIPLLVWAWPAAPPDTEFDPVKAQAALEEFRANMDALLATHTATGYDDDDDAYQTTARDLRYSEHVNAIWAQLDTEGSRQLYRFLNSGAFSDYTVPEAGTSLSQALSDDVGLILTPLALYRRDMWYGVAWIIDVSIGRLALCVIPVTPNCPPWLGDATRDAWTDTSAYRTLGWNLSWGVEQLINDAFDPLAVGEPHDLTQRIGPWSARAVFDADAAEHACSLCLTLTYVGEE